MKLLYTYILKSFYFTLFNNFKSSPFFFYSLSFFIGLFEYLTSYWPCIFFIILLSGVIFYSKRMFFVIFLFYVLGICYGLIFIPKINDIELTGKAHIVLKSIKDSRTFNKKTIYQASLKEFQTENKKYYLSSFPCTVIDKGKQKNASYSYYVKGKLSIKENYLFLKTDKLSWEKNKRKINLVNLRYKTKKKIRKYIRNKIKIPIVQSFFSVLITAEGASAFLKHIFSKTGLQHVLAISGFHFAIITLFFSYVLGFFISPYKKIIFLLIITNIYFLYIGSFPSIQRAWTMTELYLLSILLNKRYFALNALGISALIEMATRPMNVLNIGFQLSYLSVIAIFLIYPLVQKKMLLFIPSRNLNNLKFNEKGIQLILNFLREGISLSFSINLIILPLIIYNFNYFTFLSFIFNLIIPPLIIISMMLFFISSLIPFISDFLHSVNSYFTYEYLNILINIPSGLDIALYNIKIPIMTYYIIIFFIANYKNHITINTKLC